MIVGLQKGRIKGVVWLCPYCTPIFEQVLFVWWAFLSFLSLAILYRAYFCLSVWNQVDGFFSPLSSGLLKACDNYLCMAYILVYFAAIVSHYLSSPSIEPATFAASRWVQFLLKNSLPHSHFKVVALGTTTLYDMPSSPHHFLVPRCKK